MVAFNNRIEAEKSTEVVPRSRPGATHSGAKNRVGDFFNALPDCASDAKRVSPIINDIGIFRGEGDSQKVPSMVFQYLQIYLLNSNTWILRLLLIGEIAPASLRPTCRLGDGQRGQTENAD